MEEKKLNRFEVHPQRNLAPEEVERYWCLLHEHNLLAARLCTIDSPSVEDALGVIQRFPYQFYYVKVGGDITAEFMLEGFTGESAQIHFSMHPLNSTRISLLLAREVSDMILTTWKKLGSSQPYVRSLYGLTPSTNRPALFFIRRAGFLRKATLPYGIRDRGQVVDAVLTVKTDSEVGHGWN